MNGEFDPNGKGLHEPGAKADAGKVQAGVLGDFALALLAVAEVGTHGAVKYTRGGWEHVPNGAERYADAMWRHILAAKHQPADTDSGLSHKAHAAWNALAVLELELRAEKFPATDTIEQLSKGRRWAKHQQTEAGLSYWRALKDCATGARRE